MNGTGRAARGPWRRFGASCAGLAAFWRLLTGGLGGWFGGLVGLGGPSLEKQPPLKLNRAPSRPNSKRRSKGNPLCFISIGVTAALQFLLVGGFWAVAGGFLGGFSRLSGRLGCHDRGTSLLPSSCKRAQKSHPKIQQTYTPGLNAFFAMPEAMAGARARQGARGRARVWVQRAAMGKGRWPGLERAALTEGGGATSSCLLRSATAPPGIPRPLPPRALSCRSPRPSPWPRPPPPPPQASHAAPPPRALRPALPPRHPVGARDGLHGGGLCDRRDRKGPRGPGAHGGFAINHCRIHVC